MTAELDIENPTPSGSYARQGVQPGNPVVEMSTSPNANAEPYRGMASYRQEDAAIFFGREAEGELVASKIVASRFTVVHAPSGAGNTSLLNAKVIPNLEAAGFSPVTIRLQEDPIDSVRTSVLLSVLPPPEAEVETIRRMVSKGGLLDTKISIADALDVFDRLPVWDKCRAQIVEALECDVPIPSSLTKVTGKITSMFARLLGSTIELNQYLAHLQAVCRVATPPVDCFTTLDAKTPLSVLLGLVSNEAFRDAYTQLLCTLYVPQPELTVFFRELATVYGSQVPDFSIILIFDQFEELFTLFAPALNVESEAGGTRRKFKLRTDFLMQLRELYRIGETSYTGSETTPALDRKALSIGPPLRIVLSMRDEYIAQLDPLRSFVNNWDESFYHLGLLSRSQATDAIRKPAAQFKYRYAKDCLAEIVKDLTKDDNLIEPAHLQLVCERLWHAQGKLLSSQSRDGAVVVKEEALPEVTLETFIRLNRVQGILSTYLTGFLDGIQPRRSQLEALEMLQPLVTTSRTRNIVEMAVLTKAPFRDVGLREELLNKMVDAKIIRVERRLGGSFVEIVHEFLLNAVLNEIRTRLLADGDHSRLLIALADLSAATTKRDQSTLDQRTFRILQDSEKDILWNDAAVTVMARSAIQLGMNREVCKSWLQKLATGGKDDQAAIRDFLNNSAFDRDFLSIAELDDALRLDTVDQLRIEARLLVLRSLMHWSEPSHSDAIRKWIKKASFNV